MIADLHIHYPMHLLADPDEDAALAAMVRRRGRARLRDWLRALDIDTLHEWTGGHRHTGIGTDLDGFVKPALAGIESASDMAKLEERIVGRYGAEAAEQITSGNALRLLRSYWRPVAA